MSGVFSVNSLCAGYGRMRVVHDVTLSLEAGEFAAVVGRNGAGKSTALLAMGGLRFGANAGSVKLGDQELSGMSSAHIVRLGLAVVPEGHRVFPTMTVLENLRLGAFGRRETRNNWKRNLENALDLFPALTKELARPAGRLSGGGQQMVAVAQALMSEPKVLLLDEPSSGLAPAVVASIYSAIASLRMRGVALLIVEQDLGRALEHSDHCYVLDGGRIVLSGASRDLAQDQNVANIVRGVTAAIDGSAEGPNGRG